MVCHCAIFVQGFVWLGACGSSVGDLGEVMTQFFIAV
jgi:hypothetical protein